MGKKSVIGKSGQTSVPADIRKRFNLDAGSSLIWDVRDNQIVIYPGFKDPVDGFCGILQGIGSVNTLLRDRRRDKERDAKKYS